MTVFEASVFVDALVGGGPTGDASQRALEGETELAVPAIDAVAHADRVAPPHIGIGRLHLDGERCDGFPEHGQVPEESVVAVAVGLDVCRRALDRQQDEALGGVDRHGEEDAITLRTGGGRGRGRRP